MTKRHFVKCPICKYIINTNKELDEECQCPKASGGCGERILVREHVFKP